MNQLLYLSLLLLLVSCNTSPQSVDNTASPLPLTEAEADALLLQLAPYLVATPATRQEQENNTIVNHAIDKQYAVQPTNSGLYYQILTEGTGADIEWGDYIQVHYKGRFLDGKVFDSSYAKKKPLQFYVGNTIDGWNEALQLARVGTRMRLLIPSHLGYGADGVKINKFRYLVPPHSILEFELEILQLLEPPR